MKSDNPVQTKSLLIGTSGYSYEDWRGYFYPQDLSKNQMLEFYQQHFSSVEINSTYYRIPAINVIKRISEKTPAGFECIVKVNQETTHRRIENDAAMKQLIAALHPLEEQNKLKGLLAQFPYSFKNNENNRRYLAETIKLAGNRPLFFEFRHISWDSHAVHSFLESLGSGYVNVDEPSLPGLISPQAVVTSDYGYIRFHGRNESDWWDGKGSERYDYEYSENELSGWVGNIKQILRKTAKTYIFFNNHPRGQAVNNAKQLTAILSQINK